MQLKMQRSQKKGGIFGNKTIYCLDIRVEYDQAEKNKINDDKLGGNILYFSSNAERDLEAMRGSGNLKALAHFAVANLRLNVTVASIAKGHHIECPDLAELTNAENAIIEACKQLKTYVAVSKEYNGGEQVIDLG